MLAAGQFERWAGNHTCNNRAIAPAVPIYPSRVECLRSARVNSGVGLLTRVEVAAAKSLTVEVVFTETRVTLPAWEAEGIAFILDRKIMAPGIWLEASWRSFNLQEICSYRGTSYIQLGFSIYVGNGLCNGCAYILVRQTHCIHSPLGMVYAQTRWDSCR